MCMKPREDINPGTQILCFWKLHPLSFEGSWVWWKKKNASISTQGSGGKFVLTWQTEKTGPTLVRPSSSIYVTGPPFISWRRNMKMCCPRKAEEMNFGHTSFSYYIFSLREMLWETNKQKWWSITTVLCSLHLQSMSNKDHILTASSPQWWRKWNLWEVEFNRRSLGHWDHCLPRAGRTPVSPICFVWWLWIDPLLSTSLSQNDVLPYHKPKKTKTTQSLIVRMAECCLWWLGLSTWQNLDLSRRMALEHACEGLHAFC